MVEDYLADSVITNVVNLNPDCTPIVWRRKDGNRGVAVSNVITKAK